MKYKKGGVVGWILLGIGGVILLGVLGTALNLITIPWLKFNKQVKMNRDIVSQTYTAENAIYNYHWFKEKYFSIKATEIKIVTVKEDFESFQKNAGPRKDWTFEDKGEESRLRSVLTGLKNFYEDQVNEYNARASQVDRAIFKDSLPLFVNLQAY